MQGNRVFPDMTVRCMKKTTADPQAYRADLGRNYNSDKPITIQNAKSLISGRVYKSYVKLPLSS